MLQKHAEQTPAGYVAPLAVEDRTRCEVWTRVMGYHRPVNAWNKGKQQEHRDRVPFKASNYEIV